MGISANPNVLPSEQAGVAAYLPPASVSAGTAVLGASGDRIDMRKFESVLIEIHVGALGTSATLDAQARSYDVAESGSSEDLDGKAITQLTKAGDDDSDQVVLMNIRREELPEGHRYVDVLLTVGEAASIVGAVALGFYPGYGPAHGHNIDAVAEVVN